MATSRTLFSNVITLPLNTINNVKSTHKEFDEEKEK